MRKEFLLASILALGMGIAQAQRPEPMQGGTQPARPDAAQAQSPAPSGAMNGSTGAVSAQNNAAPQSLTVKNCMT